MKRIKVLFSLTLLITMSVNGQTIVFVKADASGLNNGTSWSDAYTSLQTALGAAVNGNQIWVAKGTYKPTAGNDRSIPFQMKNGVAVYGGFSGNETVLKDRDYIANPTILSGDIGSVGDKNDNSYNVFYHPEGLALDNSAILDGFTICAGNQISGGNGAGMHNDHSSPTITNCTFIGNTADMHGGGMYNYYSSPLVTNCKFLGNTSNDDGGGMYNSCSSPTLINCIFSGNSSLGRFDRGYGGGMFNVSYSSPSIINCTFSHNTTYWSGGDMGSILYSFPNVLNSIFWGGYSSGSHSPDEIFQTDVGGSASYTYCCIQGGHADIGVISSDPLFIDADGSDNIYGTGDDNPQLQSTSPCINKGISAGGTPIFDQLELARIGLPDIGAYEFGRTIFVNDDAIGGNTGVNWMNAFKDLQSALIRAAIGDNIWVAGGIYKPTTGTDRSISFQLKNGIGIYGGFAGTETSVDQRAGYSPGQVNETILSGNINNSGADDDNSYHVIYLPSGMGLNSTALLDGFTITKGYANGSDPHHRGAGIHSNNNNFTITNCTVINNTASWDAGGIFLTYSSPLISNCSILYNSGAYGGGIYAADCTPVIWNCIISNNSLSNSTGNGAGIALFGSNMLIENSIIANNSTSDDGGGMHIDHSSPTVKNCLLYNNFSKHGGGVNIIWSESNPSFYNVTFANNNSTWGDAGAAVKAVEGGCGTFYNCIFWGNKVSGTENEIYLHTGSVINLNYSCYYNAIGNFSGSFNVSNSTTSNPLFVDAANNNFHLAFSSPCISTGLNPGGNSIPTTDLEGRTRPMGSGTDMGAYECYDDAALPVELISFYANPFENSIELKWETATELNNYGFEIERVSSSTIPGQDSWEKIGFVEGHGTSNSPKEYSFIDRNPESGTLQYKLKQIDFDGNYKYYSQIAEVNFSIINIKEKQYPKEFALEQNYPNPFNPFTLIRYTIPHDSYVTIEVFSALGEKIATLVNEIKNKGYYDISFDGANLPSGIYIYRLTANLVKTGDNYVKLKKMMLIK